MENEDYYEALSDRIVFFGLGREEVAQFAKYRLGKSWRDLVDMIKQAKREAIGRDAETLFDGIAVGAYNILEVDTSIGLSDFERRVRELPRPDR